MRQVSSTEIDQAMQEFATSMSLGDGAAFTKTCCASEIFMRHMLVTITSMAEGGADHGISALVTGLSFMLAVGVYLGRKQREVEVLEGMYGGSIG